MTPSDIVAKLWNLCNILKYDGVTYHQYVTELTYLLFLKMARETGAEDQLPAGHRWADLEARAAPDRLEFYKILLIHLGSHGSTLVQEIFAKASSFIKKPATLSTLVAEIDKIDWYSVHREDLGDLYEGLLEKNANEKKSGAGQYFTPRALITTSRQRLAVAVNAELTRLYWTVGQRLSIEVLGGERASYGSQLLDQLGQQLSHEFGCGFEARNLRRMVKFAQAFPEVEIVSTLLTKLSWSHFLQLLPLKVEPNRWYSHGVLLAGDGDE